MRSRIERAPRTHAAPATRARTSAPAARHPGNRAAARVLSGSAPRGVQRTIQDLLAAQNDWTELANQTGRAKNYFHGEAQRLVRFYGRKGVTEEHNDPLVERATQGMRHDAKELLSHAGGYLLQQAVAHESRETAQFSHITGGTSNRSEPDLIGHTRAPGEIGADMPTAIEVKRTIGASYGTPLGEGVRQLQARREYPRGRLVIHMADPAVAAAIDPVAARGAINGKIGQYARGFSHTMYQSINVQIHGPGGLLVDHTVNPRR